MSQFESLCIVKKRDEFAEPTLYRIGDIENGVISQAYYENGPITIGNRKGEEKIVESIQVRAWKPREDDERKNDSILIDVPVYEVIFLDDYVEHGELDEGAIRSALYNGIDIPEGLSEDFLIVLSGDDQLRTAIVCNCRDFIREGNRLYLREDCSDLLHIKPCFDLIKIASDELISTEPLYERVSTFYADENRYFFAYLDIEDLKVGVLRAYPIEKYASNYVRSFLSRKKKELEITKKDINAIANAFDDLVKERSLLEYFSTTGYPIKDVEATIKANTSIMVAELMGMDDKSLFVRDVLKQDFGFYTECLSTVRDEWLKTADGDRERIEEELHSLNNRKSEIESICAGLEEKRAGLAADIDESEKAYKALAERERLIEEGLEQKLNSFKSDVVEIAFTQAFASQTVTGGGIEEEAFSVDNNPSTDNEIDDLYEIAEVLSDNLVIGGVKESYANDCALYLLASIMLERGIILPATISRHIADALSYSIDACNAATVICPNNYGLKSLVAAISKLKGRVVLVKNCIDSIRWDLLELSRIGCDDKVIIFDFNLRDNLDYMPDSIRKQSSIIADDSFMIPRIYPKYEGVFVDNKTIRLLTDEAALNERFKLLQQLRSMIDIDEHGLYSVCAIETAISNIITTKSMLNIFNITSVPHAVIDNEEFERWLQEFLGENKTRYILEQVK